MIQPIIYFAVRPDCSHKRTLNFDSRATENFQPGRQGITIQFQAHTPPYLYIVQFNSVRCNMRFMSNKRANVSAKPKGSPLLGEQLCFALYSTSLTMTKVYRKLLRELGLTYPQYLVMLVLWERDGVSVSEIGERLYLNSATLTPLLKRIEALGLISRHRAQEDERQVIVSLSRAGRELRQKSGDVQHGVFRASGCTVEDLVAIKQRLDLLRNRLMENA